MANMAKRAQQERVTVVDRARLLSTLEDNLKKHCAEYEAAVVGFKKASLLKLDEALATAQEKLRKNYDTMRDKLSAFRVEDLEDFGDTFKLVESITVRMPIPRDYSEVYRIAINMMGWDTRDEVELSYAEFQCFVMDEWDWTSDFKFATAAYLGHA